MRNYRHIEVRPIAGALGAEAFCVLADGDEQPATATSAAANATSSVRFIMTGSPCFEKERS